MDISKVTRELDWHPQQSLSSGLLKTVAWYLESQAWVDAIRTQQDYQGWLERNYAERGGQS
jgi:dTDP-glucose 4,6-dehydratase